MDKKELRERFKEENNTMHECVCVEQNDHRIVFFHNDYVYWLENKISEMQEYIDELNSDAFFSL